MEYSLPKESSRFQELQALLRSALLSSRNNFDIPKIIKEEYGDDAAIFGGSSESENNGMLRQVFESMLDRIHDDATEYMSEVLEQEHVQVKLLQVETLIAKLENEDRMQQQLDDLDKESTRKIAELAKQRASGMEDVNDIIVSKTYQQLSEQKEGLQTEIQAIEETIQQLQKEYEEKTVSHKALDSELSHAKEEMERSAAVGKTMQSSSL
ncbi:hypothetical protein ACA910_021122 [Epithemia clementina (nom. ined.)]